MAEATVNTKPRPDGEDKMGNRIADIRSLPAPGETPETAPQTARRKVDRDLFDLVRNRVLMGAARYSTGRSVWHEQALIEPLVVTENRLISKLLQFMWTRNLEFLVDVIVYANLIFRFGVSPRLHFEAVERHNIVKLKAEADRLSEVLGRELRRTWPDGTLPENINLR